MFRSTLSPREENASRRLVTAQVGSRVYLLDDDETYSLFKLKNREFTVDIDDSQLGCGLNGALYFTGMSADGDMGKGNNNAGAKYGTGYCPRLRDGYSVERSRGDAAAATWILCGDESQPPPP